MLGMQARVEPDILKVAILEMGRMRGDKSFCPSEVVRWLYPVDWRHFMPDIQAKMMELYRAGNIIVSQNGKPISKEQIPRGPVRISVNF